LQVADESERLTYSGSYLRTKADELNLINDE